MGNIMTRRAFLQSSAIIAALSGTACAQSQQGSAANGASSSASGSQLHAKDVLGKMTTEQKVAQMIMPCFRSLQGVTEGVTNLEQVPALAEALRRHQYGGVILFGANVENTEQTVRLVHDLQTNNAKGSSEKGSVAIPYLVAADQEGGAVARVSMGTRGTGSMALGAVGDDAEKFAYGTGSIFGDELSALGINLNLGPCADVVKDLSGEGMSVRVFSDDTETVERMSVAFKGGVDLSGVITCFKHFPGASDGSDDPTAVKCTLDELREEGLASFKYVIDEGAEMVMTAATTFPGFDDTHTLADGKTVDCYPASMSPKIVTDLLRKELGFEGVVITDALEMDQFFSAPETNAQLFAGERNSLESMVFIAQKCIEAGCDILLMPRDMKSTEIIDWYDGYIKGIVDLVEKGTLSEERIDESVLRILSLKEKHSLLNSYINGDDVDKAISEAREVVGADGNHEAERNYAEQAVTLLKDNGVLPIPADAEKIVIVGRRENAKNPVRYAIAELETAGIFNSGLYINDLLTGEQVGQESAKTKITIGSYYHLDDDGNGSVAITEGLLPAIAEANYVICESTVFAGIGKLQESDPCVQGVTQILTAAHAAGAKFVILSDGIPVEAARYSDADAVVCAYMYAGFDVDPTADNGNGLMGAINANVPAALRAIFGAIGMTGTLPIEVKGLAKASDGSWRYTTDVACARGSGIKLSAK